MNDKEIRKHFEEIEQRIAGIEQKIQILLTVNEIHNKVIGMLLSRNSDLGTTKMEVPESLKKFTK